MAPTFPMVRVAATVLLVALVLPAVASAAKAPHPSRRKATPPAPNDPLWQREWGPRAVSMPVVWRLPLRRRVTVAVVDTGVDATQPDLAGVIVPGWNTLSGSADTADDNGHGTMVAGVIAGRANNRIGVAGYCRACTIMPVKVLDGSGHGSGAAIGAGIDWAIDHGADVVNLSLVLTNEDSSVTAAIARAVAAGVVVVASAGNDGPSGPTYPAALPGVVAVGAADASGSLYPWSNAGDWLSVAAPGCNLTTYAGGGFGEFCGTSSATAALSGVLGAVRATSAASTPALASALAAAHTVDAASLVLVH
jgi:subtilisin family serine protease